MEQSTRPRRITSAEWETYKAEILELFPTLEKKDLLEHLKKKHGFCPTPNQYERQKKKWDMMKNITTEDWGYIKKVVERRKRVNKKTRVVAHGRVLSPQQLRRGMKRVSAASTFFNQTSEDGAEEPPDGIYVSTPLAETSISRDDISDSPFAQFEVAFDKYAQQYSSDVLAAAEPFRLEFSGITELSAPYGTNLAEVPGDALLNSESTRFNDRSATLQSTGSELSNISGKSLLSALLNENEKLEDPTYIEQMECLFREVVLEGRDGVSRCHVPQLSWTPSRQQFEILRYIIYLGSNNLLPQCDSKVLRWISDSNNFWIIEVLMVLGIPTVTTFAIYLLRSAVVLRTSSNVYQWLGEKIFQVLKSIASSGCFCSAVQSAVAVRNIAMLRLLIEAGGTYPDQGWESIFLEKTDSLSNETYRESVQFVIDHCADLNQIGDRTLLEQVIESNDVEAVRMLLRSGASVNKIPRDSATPLQAAAGYGNVEMVELLIQAGADIDTPIGTPISTFTEILDDPSTETCHCLYATPLQIAIARDKTEVIEVLLRYGADVNGFDATWFWNEWYQSSGNLWEEEFMYGCDTIAPVGFWNQEVGGIECASLVMVHSPLRHAAARGDSALVSRLLKLGANLDGMTVTGTALQAAAARKMNLGLVKYLVGQGADVNAPAPSLGGRTALQAAIEVGDMESTHFLLESGANVNSDPCLIYGKTALQAAVQKKDLILTKLLLALGANANEKALSITSRPALRIASEMGNMQMVELLLKHGANPNIPRSKESNATTPLQGAIAGNHLLVVVKLLDHGADPNMGGSMGGNMDEGHLDYVNSNPLRDSVCLRKPQMTRLLLERGADPDANYEASPLAVAISNDDKETTKILIEYGADVNALRDSDSKSMLAIAATISASMCQLLIEAGAELQGDKGTAALHSATSECQSETIQFLLSKGVHTNWERNTQSGNGIQLGSPLAQLFGSPKTRSKEILTKEISVRERNAEILLSHGAYIRSNDSFGAYLSHASLYMITRLIDAGLKVDCRTEYGGHLLHDVSSEGKTDIVQLLLKAGADVNLQTRNGTVALHGAVRGQHFQVVELLLAKGADANIKRSDVMGDTVLQAAVAGGSMPLVVLLLKSGADVNATSTGTRRSTALHTAAWHGRLDIAHLLVKKDKEPETLQMRCEEAADDARKWGFPVLANELRKWGRQNAAM